MTTSQTLPRWDMTRIYPNLESPEFARGFSSGVQNITDLAQLFDAHSIMEQSPQAVDEAVVQTFETVTTRCNTVFDSTRTLVAYINSFILTDSQNRVAQARMSELQGALATLSMLGTRYTAWIGSLDVDALIGRSQIAREHEYALRRAKVQAAHLMPQGEEALAAELNISGGTAWARLHGNVTSQLSVAVEVGGKDLPMSVIRNLAYDTDRTVRHRAYQAELAGWEWVALPPAAALNSIKHEVLVVTQRRCWESPLDASLFANSIDRQTLDAMLAATRAAFPDFQRYLRAKARALGLTQLAWYDLSAPIGTSSRVWEFNEAASFIIEQFA